VSSGQWGALLGGVTGTGAWLVAVWVVTSRRGAFEARVLRPLGDMPQLARSPLPETGQGPFRLVFSPALQAAAAALERLVGGSASIRRRIERAGLDLTVHQFRVEQVTWGVVALAGGSALAILAAMRSPERFVPFAVLALLGSVLGVLLRENRLTAQVRAHEEQVLAELPAVAELLALSVAAGEGPVAALERVVSRSRGALSRDLARVLGEIRTGTPVAAAFDAYAGRTGLPVVARFASGVAVAVERGTPLADVLHAQAGDVREAQRRGLIESGARREVAMMIPVVFLVLPTTILFAFWPGVVGLRMVTP
jgi:tight adherence protein C